jgi:ankyrin repeat protein
MNELISAILQNDFIMIKKILKSGIDINQPLELEDTDNIFFYAIKHKVDVEILKLLIENGLDLTYTNELGIGILDEALNYDDLDFIKYLVEEKNLNPLVTNRKSGFTPIMQVASYGYLDIVKYLVKKGADIEERDNFGFNAKDYARKLGQTSVLEYLNSL